MSEWISVKKYNPPFEIPVLAVVKHRDDIGCTEVQVCTLDEDGNWVLEGTYEDPREEFILYSIGAVVTHWVILPSPPKKENPHGHVCKKSDVKIE